MDLFSTHALIAAGSTVSFFMAEIPMEFLLQKVVVFENDSFDLTNVLW